MTLTIGNELYLRAINECRPEHRELMEEVWSPTPWMLDVHTAGREQEIWHWCYQNFGNESSPIHSKVGSWMRGSVTMMGKTWFGFESKVLMERFESNFQPVDLSVTG